MGDAAQRLPANSNPISRPWLAEHQFQKGVSGNPNGRPKDADRLAAFIRDNTKGCREVAVFMLSVMRGELPGFKAQERMRAAEWLVDRGVGKAKEIAGDLAPIPYTELSDDELTLLGRIAARRSAAAGGDSSGTDQAQSGEASQARPA